MVWGTVGDGRDGDELRGDHDATAHEGADLAEIVDGVADGTLALEEATARLRERTWPLSRRAPRTRDEKARRGTVAGLLGGNPSGWGTLLWGPTFVQDATGHDRHSSPIRCCS